MKPTPQAERSSLDGDPPRAAAAAHVPNLAARRAVDAFATGVMTTCGLLAVVVLLGIFVLLSVHAGHAFLGGIETQPITPTEAAILGPETVAALEQHAAQAPRPLQLIRDVTWQPDGVDRTRYGVIALVLSTLMTTGGALLLAVPISIATAAWLSSVATGPLREGVKFGVELIAALPSVVVGFVGIQVTGPFIGWLFGVPGGLTALNGAVLLAIMALPTIVSLSEDALSSVPRHMVQGSLALGADRWQTLLHVEMPAARSGLFAAVMLGMGRAIGETMTVLMATGNAAALPASLLDPVRTLTATLAIELGEVPRGTSHYYMLFTVGLLLFLITLAINMAAEWVGRRQQRMLGRT